MKKYENPMMEMVLFSEEEIRTDVNTASGEKPKASFMKNPYYENDTQGE